MSHSQNPQPYLTADGSSTLFSPRFDQHYHSVHGAIQESMHVFIKAGLEARDWQREEPVHIFEMGLGTGLNAWLTWISERGYPVHYTALEAYPLSRDQWSRLNFPQQLHAPDGQTRLNALHEADWNKSQLLGEGFALKKVQNRLEDFEPENKYDLVYWDAFAPGAQPELWTEEVFRRIFEWMNPAGIWVSYCAKGVVRRALQAAGLEVERIPGPPGKREMLRARKPE